MVDNEVPNTPSDSDDGFVLVAPPVVVSEDLHVSEIGSQVEQVSDLVDRFSMMGDRTALSRVVPLSERVVRACPSSHSLRAMVLCTMGRVLLVRFNQFGGMGDLRKAVEFGEAALELCPLGHRDRALCLTNLANALHARSNTEGSDADLELSIELQREALGLREAQHADLPQILNSLGQAVHTKFHRTGNQSNLKEAIECHEHALQLCPVGHPERAVSLNSLADALHTRYDQEGDSTDLTNVIDYHQEALSLRPEGHPERPLTLNDLADAFRARFHLTGNTSDLDNSVSCFQRSYDLCPPGHPLRATSLSNLATTLWTRFEHLGNLLDLDRAIASSVAVLDICPAGHPLRVSTLNNLAAALHTRFRQAGDVSDLNKAIEHYQTVLDNRPPGHHERSMSLNNLANALHARFEYEGSIKDLNKAIDCYRDVVQLCPTNHPLRFTCLNNFAGALWTRYEYEKRTGDLNEAIERHMEAVQRCPSNHPMRSHILNNLGKPLLARFKNQNDISDLYKSIEYHEAALQLRPAGHPLRCPTLVDLSNAVQARFEHEHRTEDLDRVISLRREAVDSCPDGHPMTSSYKNWLAMSLLLKAEVSNHASIEHTPSEDARAILDLLQAASSGLNSPSADRLLASCNWILVSHKMNHSSTLKAYQTMIDLLDIVVARGHSLEARHSHLSTFEILKRAKGLVVDAAAYAIEKGDPQLALEFLDRGMAIIFSQLGRYRTSLDDLGVANKELAARFERLSRQLESSVMSDGAVGQHPKNPHEDDIARYSRLTNEWTQVITQIRTMKGFQDFLRPTSATALQDAAKKGPVIVINASSRRSDAIIVTKDRPPLLVPLPEATLEVLQYESRRLTKKMEREVIIALQTSWRIIVAPIVTELTRTLALPKKSRIWWCTTAATSKLPLHAAGEYRRGGQNLPDLYISSYTPTLGALIRARRQIGVPTGPPSVFIVGQPNTPGQTQLPAVPEEIARVKRQFPNATLLEGPQGTQSAVLAGVAQHQWVHMSCHGHLNNTQPFRSNFSLHDGPLYLLDLVEQQLPQAELAFLSACHSAAGDRNTPDEFLHLAAAMQFAGFRSVVGTMWAMVDEDGPIVAEEFYKRLLAASKEGKPDCTQAALALSRTIRLLRMNGVPPSRWINFVHFGA